MNFVSLFAQSSYYSQDVNTANVAAIAAAILVAVAFMFIVVVVIYAVTALLLSRIFKKAGIDGWKAWVPIYNNWVMLELGGQKGYWAIFAVIPFLSIVSAIFMLIAMYRIGIGFGKDGAFVLLAIFLSPAWYIWLAFDTSTWTGPRQLRTRPAHTRKDPGMPTQTRKK